MHQDKILVINASTLEKKWKIEIIKSIIYSGRKGKSTNALWIIIDKNELGAKWNSNDICEIIKRKFGLDFFSLFDICVDYSFEKTSSLSLSNKTIINTYTIEQLFKNSVVSEIYEAKTKRDNIFRSL